MNRFKDLLRRLDIFDPTTSTVVYYLTAYLFPLAVFLRIPTKYFDFAIAAWNPVVLILLTAGLAALLLGSFSAAHSPFAKGGRVRRFVARPWDNTRRNVIYVGAIAIALSFALVWIWGGSYLHVGPQGLGKIGMRLYSLVSSLQWLFVVTSLVLAFERHFSNIAARSSETRKSGMVAWGLLGMAVAYGLFSASRYAALFPCFIYMLVRHYRWRKYRVTELASIALLGAIVMSLINVYKEPNIWMRSYLPNNSSRTVAAAQYLVDNSLGRLSPYPVLQKVFESRERYRGETLKGFFVSVGVPRILWESKPVVSPDGNAFGHRLGIIDPKDSRTTVTPTTIGDLYLNFGIWGMLAGMYVLGYLLRTIAIVCSPRGPSGPLGLLAYTVVWLQLVKGMEDWIAPVYAGTFKMLVILLLLHLFAMKRDAEPAPDSTA